jgi:citrate lyase subunit beta/citryl-CoA lyase
MTSLAWLFVPGSRSDRFDKAAVSGADELILDLEDAVAPADKGDARDAVADWLGRGSGWVRINAAGTEWFEADVAALATLPGLRGLMLPKSEDVAVLERLAGILGGRRIIALIETCLGLARARELAGADGVARLAFGSVDFALDLGAVEDDLSLLTARSELVLASRLAGLAAPIDGVTTVLRDAGAIARAAERSHALGFGGKLCIHPAQISPVRVAFAPAAEEIAWAREVLAAASVSAVGAVSVRGQMVDRPVVERARRILEV